MRGGDSHGKMEGEEWLSVCLYPTVNYLVKVTNLINASLRLSFSLIPFLLSFLCRFSSSSSLSRRPLYVLINREQRYVLCSRFNCTYCRCLPRRPCFFFLIERSAGSLINQRRWTIQRWYLPRGICTSWVVHDLARACAFTRLCSFSPSKFNLF